MNREEIIALISGIIKPIRLDLGYSQEKMAEMLGLSKKHLYRLKNNECLQAGRLSLLYVLCFVNILFFKRH